MPQQARRVHENTSSASDSVAQELETLENGSGVIQFDTPDRPASKTGFVALTPTKSQFGMNVRQ